MGRWLLAVGEAMNGAPRQLRCTLDTLINAPPPETSPYKARDDQPVSLDGKAVDSEEEIAERILCQQQRKLVECGVQRLVELRVAADSWAAEARLALGDGVGDSVALGTGPVAGRHVVEELLGRDVVRVVQVMDRLTF